jgi:uncharacterized RDD family membrane protein YckC
MEELRGKRVRAAWTDIAFLFIAFVAFGAAADRLELGPTEFEVEIEGVPAFAYFAFVFAYYFIFERAAGQTPGKRLVGIAVADAKSGEAATSWQIVIRTFARFVDWLPVFYLAGYISMRATEHGMRLGDLAAKTTVRRAVDLSVAPRASMRSSAAIVGSVAVLLLALTFGFRGDSPPSDGPALGLGAPDARSLSTRAI